jgi:GNAT superfamily N-acetyltransferase
MKNSTIKIAPATVNDARTVLEFITALAEYEKLPHEVVATEELLKETLFGKKQIAEVVIAYDNGIAAGFALYFHNFSTFLGRPGIYLEDLFVKPNFRGKKIGTALLKHVARIAQERQCGRFEWSVLNWNEPSIRFYESLGAVPMDDWTMYRVTGKALDILAEGGD